MKFFWHRDDLAGVDDPIAEQALAKRTAPARHCAKLAVPAAVQASA
jgi:hypothetical protein